MTPLIDVLLVLLIIFMAIAPSRSTGLDAKIPQAPTDEKAPPAENLVISIRADRSLKLNSQDVSHDELQRLLRQAPALEPDRAVFLQGARELEYRDVARVLDDLHSADVLRVGLLTGRALPFPGKHE